MNKGGGGHGSRVVARSNNNSNTNGGVAYANTNYDSSNTNTNIGARLANSEGRMPATSAEPCQTRGREAENHVADGRRVW